MTDNIIFNAALVFFVIAPVFDAVVSFLLWKAYRASKNVAIRERLISSLALWASTSLIALLALFRMLDIHPDSSVTIITLLASLMLASVPSINWLYTYLTDSF